jgi:hypothetical protein
LKHFVIKKNYGEGFLAPRPSPKLEGRDVYRVLVGRPEGKRPLGRPRRRWKDNIKLDLRER